MKRSLPTILVFLTFSAKASEAKRVLGNALKVDEKICAETIKPKIKKGEVKISYPCEAVPTPAETESEKITFFERKIPQNNDLIIRHRTSKKEKDFTLKFRKPNVGAPFEFDEATYNALKDRDDAKEVNFKCEADVTFGATPNVNESCSLATPTDFFTPDHDTFMSMVNKTVPTKKEELVPYEINSVSWKLPSSQFAKGISLEKWLVEKNGKKLCILEISGKFEVPKGGTMDETVKTSMAALKGFFPDLTPGKIQGNKTGRALEFLKNAGN